jgi:hypothetical protein
MRFRCGRAEGVKRAVLSFERVQKIGECGDGGRSMARERKKMAVAGDDDVGLGQLGAFQNPVIRLIFEEMQVRPGFQHRGGLADGPEKLLDARIGPVELGRSHVAADARP